MQQREPLIDDDIASRAVRAVRARIGMAGEGGDRGGGQLQLGY